MQRERFPTPIGIEGVMAYRSECQSVTHVEQGQVREMAFDIQQHFLQEFGQFVHPKSIRLNRNISERVIVASDLELIFNSLGVSQAKIDEDSNEINGFADFPTGLIFIEDRLRIADDLIGRGYPLFIVDDLTGVSSDLVVGSQGSTIAHEIVHQYQDKELPRLFQEMSAFFYEDEIVGDESEIELSEMLKIVLANGYEQLLEHFGEDVHKLSFGLLADFQCRREILRSIDFALVSVL